MQIAYKSILLTEAIYSHTHFITYHNVSGCVKMLNKFFKLISYLIVLGIQVAYNLFVIWGLVIWDTTNPWIAHSTTIILLSVPTLIVFNIVFMVIVFINFVSLVSKEDEEAEERKGFRTMGKIGRWIKKEAAKEKKEEKEVEVPDKVTQWFKDLAKEEEEIKVPDKVVQWFKELAKEAEKE